MGDLQWLIDEANRIKQGQMQEFVAIPLVKQYQQIEQDLSQPISPNIQQIFKAIEENRKKNPAYIPFKPGTPTLSKQSQEFEKFKWLKAFEEQQKQQQFENQLKLKQLAISAQKASSSSTNEYMPSTATERKNYYKSQLYSLYQDKVNKLWADFAQKYKSGPPVPAVYEVLNEIEGDMIRNIDKFIMLGITYKDIKEAFTSIGQRALGTKGFQDYLKAKKEGKASFIDPTTNKPYDINLPYDIDTLITDNGSESYLTK